MMNVNNSDMDLGLALGISNQSAQTRWNDNPGAGVNAGSRVDMTFAASDPLSELVWSPKNGLRLKCAVSNLADKKTALPWDIGQSSLVFSPSHSIRSRETKDEKPISEGNSIAAQATCHVDSEVAKCASLAKSPRSSACPLFGSSHEHTGTNDKMEEVNNVERVSVVHFNEMEGGYTDKEKECLCSSKSIQIGEMAEPGQEDQRTADLLPLLTNEPRSGMEISEPLSEQFKEEGMADCDGKTEYTGSGGKRLGFNIGLASKIHTGKQCKAPDSQVPNLPSPERRSTELSIVIKERKDEMKMNGSTSAPFLEKLESTAENDVQFLITKEVCGPSEERAQRGESVQDEASSSGSRICVYQRKGKEREKSSSNREVGDGTSKEDDSHGSMESCNSANLISKGKRRLSFDQQLILGSKRIKQRIQESPPPTSLVRPESSFVNWILNMVKGSAKSNLEEGHSLALTVCKHESCDPKIASCNKTRDFGSRKMGFQTVFQSLYCPDTKVQETRMQVDDCSVGGSKELILDDNTFGANTTPISCHGEDDKSCKQFLISSDDFKETTSGYGEGPSIHACKNKKLSNLLNTEAKDGVSSLDSSRGQKKSRSAKCNSSDPLSEGKTIEYMRNTGDEPLGSLWIARYSPKTPCPVLNSDHCDESTCRIKFSIDQKSLEARESSTDDTVNVVAKELQNYAPKTEASIGFKKIGIPNCKKPAKVNSSDSLKSPKEMASVFARRLDALKHIRPTAVRDNPSHLKTTCFFCGKSGHELWGCSEVKENEVVGLLRNISLYGGAAEETPCLCIKCFRLDHWAATCPWAGEVQRGTGYKRSSMSETKDRQSKVADICNLRKCRTDTDITFNLKVNGKIFSEQRILNLDELQMHIASSSGEDKLSEEQLTPLFNFACKQISDPPKGMFDTIRRLRLSRTDILKNTKTKVIKKFQESSPCQHWGY